MRGAPGSGSAFCSGVDTDEFGGDEANRRALLESTARCFRAVARCPKPVVAAVNGPALGGGFALALLCDVRLASTTATFGFPGLARGIPRLLRRRPGGARARGGTGS